MGRARFGVKRQLLAVQRYGLHAAAEAVGNGQAASVSSGGVLAYVTAEVDAVVEVERAEGPRRCARGGVHPVQHQLSIVTVHLQRGRVPLAIVDLSAVHRDQTRAAPAVKLVLQTPVDNLRIKQEK